MSCCRCWLCSSRVTSRGSTIASRSMILPRWREYCCPCDFFLYLEWVGHREDQTDDCMNHYPAYWTAATGRQACSRCRWSCRKTPSPTGTDCGSWHDADSSPLRRKCRCYHHQAASTPWNSKINTISRKINEYKVKNSRSRLKFKNKICINSKITFS